MTFTKTHLASPVEEAAGGAPAQNTPYQVLPSELDRQVLRKLPPGVSWRSALA